MEQEVKISRYHSRCKEEWNEFLKASKNSLFMFDRNYMDYHSERFMDHSLLFYVDGRLSALFPANEANGCLYSHGGLTHGGLLLDKKTKQHSVIAIFEELIRYARKNGLEKIYYKTIPHIYHEQPAEEDRYALYINGAALMEVLASTVINLKDPIKMPKGRKAQISRAKREGVEVRKLTEKKYFDIFIDMENEILVGKHHTRAVHTSDELYLLYTRFPEQIHLYGAFMGDNLISGVVIYEYGQVIHTQYMATNELARAIGALDLIVSIIIEEYKATKLWLDFGVSTEDGGRYLNEGLISQKEGFGGRTNVYELWKLEL